MDAHLDLRRGLDHLEMAQKFGLGRVDADGDLLDLLREDNPGKIVSGFGGTLCLVLSFLYVLATVILTTYGAPWSSFTFWLGDYRYLCLAAFAALSFVLGWVPYRLGMRQVSQMEL